MWASKWHYAPIFFGRRAGVERYGAPFQVEGSASTVQAVRLKSEREIRRPRNTIFSHYTRGAMSPSIHRH